MISEYLNKRGFSDEIIKKWQLRDIPEDKTVLIPYKDLECKVLYDRKRYYGEDGNEPKYKSPNNEDLPEGHSWLYGLWQLKDINLEELAIVEGEFNSISVNIAGFYALGIAGQGFKLSKEILKVLPKGIKKITLLYDDYSFAVKHAEEIKQNYDENCSIKIAVYPDKSDANNYIEQNRQDELKQIIQNAKPYYNGHIIEEVTISEVESVVNEYFPEYLLDALCCIDVVTSMVFKNFANPIALFMVGAPSSGKTTVLDMFMVSSESLKEYVYRCDNFTPRAWLSHIASQRKDKLKEIHLLPRIEDKTMVTKDLSCLFSKNFENLEEDIGVVTVVLDGRGLSTDSGSKGKVEYTGKNGHVYFCWIGATTPMTRRVWDVIGVKGNRFLFLNIKDRNIDEDFIIDSLYGEVSYNLKVERCADIIAKYVRYFYYIHGQYKVEWDISIDRKSFVVKNIVRLAKLVAVLRAPIKYFTGANNDGRTQITQNLIEAPYRLTDQLTAIARSNALNHERKELDFSDLKIIRYIALASIPYENKLALEALLSSEEKESGRPKLRTSSLAEKLNVTRYKAKNLILLFGLLGICDITNPQTNISESGNPYTEGEYIMVLKTEYLWLLDDIWETSEI